MKKLFAVILPLVLVTGTLTGCIGGGTEASTSLGYVSIDINPSVQFVTDEDDEVVGVSASNDDGEMILMGVVQELLGLSVEEAAERVVELAMQYGFLNPDALETDPNAVTITTVLEDEDEQDENEFREKITTRVRNFFRNNGVFGVVMTDIDMEAVVAEAEELGIEAGRLKLIKSVQAVYPELTLEQATNKSVKELMEMLRELKGAKARIEKRIDLVAHFTEKVTEITAEVAQITTDLAVAQAEVATLNLVDITLLDEAGLAAHNVALGVATDEVTALTAALQEVQDELADLQDAMANHQDRLDDIYVEELQEEKAEKLEQARQRYEDWQANKAQRASDIAERWNTFEQSLTEQQRQAILDYMNNHWGAREGDEVTE